MEQTKTVTRKLLFEDNVGLSEEEEDIILTQCIRSGMPKVSCVYIYLYLYARNYSLYLYYLFVYML